MDAASFAIEKRRDLVLLTVACFTDPHLVDAVSFAIEKRRSLVL